MKSKYDQELTEELDHCLDQAIENILFKEIGLGGNLLIQSDDPEQTMPEIEAWAKVRNVRLFHVSDDKEELRRAYAYSRFENVTKAHLAPTNEEIEALSAEPTILIIHGIDKMETSYRRLLLDLMNDHIVSQESEPDKFEAKFLDKLLFVIGLAEKMDRNEEYKLLYMEAKNGFFTVDM